jgi:hypothetical protein
MKELMLIGSLIAVIAFGAIYWHYVQEREYKSLIKRLQNVPIIGAILVFFGFDD